jgi:hypothetical protein
MPACQKQVKIIARRVSRRKGSRIPAKQLFSSNKLQHSTIFDCGDSSLTLWSMRAPAEGKSAPLAGKIRFERDSVLLADE